MWATPERSHILESMTLPKSLKAWRYAQQLAVECSRACRSVPDVDQRALADRLRRAAYAVPIAVAAGHTEPSPSRAARRYRQARQSLAELIAGLELAKDLEYIPLVAFARLEALGEEVGRTLYGLARSSETAGAAGPRRVTSAAPSAPVPGDSDASRT
jgi:four helix bundle protein